LLWGLVDKIQNFWPPRLTWVTPLWSNIQAANNGKKKTKFDGLVTPVNNLGAMMFPTKNHVETALTEAKKHGKLIVAIKPFAGGRIKLEEALDYVFRKAKVDACMVEVGSKAEAEIDFRAAEKVLFSLPCSSR